VKEGARRLEDATSWFPWDLILRDGIMLIESLVDLLLYSIAYQHHSITPYTAYYHYHHGDRRQDRG